MKTIKLKFKIFKFINELKRSIKLGNKKKWLNNFKINDDVTMESLSKWFDIFCNSVFFKKCSIYTFFCKAPNKIKCIYIYSYYLWKPIVEIVTYTLKTSHNGFEIVWMEKENVLSFMGHCELKSIINNVQKKAEQIGELKKVGKDFNSISQYSRLITKNIRYRQSNPMIECASILSCMMSEYVYKIAKKIISNKKRVNIIYIYNSLIKLFRIQIFRNERQNNWSSKITIPWYGLEELLAIHKKEERVPVNCQLFMSLFYSILRICGLSSENLLIFRIDYHDYLIIKQENKLYITDNSSLHFVTKKNMLPFTYNKVLLYDETWVNTVSDINHYSIKSLKEFILFLLKYRKTKKDKTTLEYNWKINTKLKDFVHYVLSNSILQPNSSYVWAKYSFQTLYTGKPESYVYWSINNITLKKSLNFLQNDTDLYKFIQKIEKQSIFLEKNRLMTSDQIIRCKCGDNKSLAVFLYSILKNKFDGIGGIIITQNHNYCAFCNNNIWKLYDIKTFKTTKLIKGKIILIFNENSSYFPINEEYTKCPKWFIDLYNTLEIKEIINES